MHKEKIVGIRIRNQNDHCSYGQMHPYRRRRLSVSSSIIAPKTLSRKERSGYTYVGVMRTASLSMGYMELEAKIFP